MMTSNAIALLALFSPAVFTITSLLSWFQPGMRPNHVKRFATASTVLSILIAAISGFFVTQHGLIETATLGYQGLGFSLRIDALSSLMFGMIALLGFIVVRFSQNYLDGDERQGAFLGRLAAAIASVQLLVLSGNIGLLILSWVLTSMSLNKLLIFYHDRPGAIIAARKKYIVARLGDLSLLAAIALLYIEFGTGNMEYIFQSINASLTSASVPSTIEFVAFFLVFAALLKSAQFPAHGWLIEVMETPTPVSALLHAGLLNAGPFLIIRMAFVLDASTYAPLILISIGGFTALFASIVYLTQSSVKTALGYSSVAHMGFSLMVCGLGVYPAAMLHLVAHSFYKAHAFLSSGSVIDVIRSSKVTGAKRLGNPLNIALGIVLGLGVYIVFAIIWGINPAEDLALITVGAVIALGLSRLFTSAIDSNGSLKLMLRAGVLSLIVTFSFFSLESGMHLLLASQFPALGTFSLGKMILTGIVLSLFAVAIFIQIVAPALCRSPYFHSWAVHIKNGLYVNTIFDGVVRALYAHGSQTKLVFIEHKNEINKEAFTEVKSYKQQTV